MSYQNIQDYMSFFFVGKYINSNNISIRNIAPDINDKKDILSKTAKLINLGINYNIAPKNSLNYVNIDKNLEASTNAFFEEFSFRVKFDPSQRTRARLRNPTLAEYCAFNMDYKLSADVFGRVKNTFVDVTDANARKFYISLIAGANIGNRDLVQAIYTGYYETHLINLFANAHMNPDIKLKVFDSDDNVHEYLSGFMSFIHHPEYLMQNNNANNISFVSGDRFGRIGAFQTGPNKINSLELSSTEINRWNRSIVNFVLDHIDTSSYYNVAGSLSIAKMHEIISNNKYVCPVGDISKINDIPYIGKSLLNDPNISRDRKIANRFIRGVNGTSVSPFVYIVKIQMPKNKVVYLMLSNMADALDQKYQTTIHVNIGFTNAAFTSSASFEDGMETIKRHLDSRFKTVNDNG